MTDLKGFSFTNIFLKVTFQIGVYLVHPFKISKLLLHTHTTTAARFTEIAQLGIFIFFNAISVFSENMFFCMKFTGAILIFDDPNHAV